MRKGRPQARLEWVVAMPQQYQVVYSTDEFCHKCSSAPCRCGQKPAATRRPSTPRQTESARGGPKIKLDRSGRKGKAVTVVFNLGLAEAALRELLRELQKSCGSGGTISGGAIEIQGDHRDRIETLLRERGIHLKRAGG